MTVLQKDDGTSAVVLKNPMAKEFQIVRTSLYAGLCKTLNQQKSVGSRGGIRIFEVSDVCVLDDTTDVGARNERMMAAMYSGPTAGFEVRVVRFVTPLRRSTVALTPLMCTDHPRPVGSHPAEAGRGVCGGDQGGSHCGRASCSVGICRGRSWCRHRRRRRLRRWR